MSFDLYMCCMDCKEHIHVGQNGYLYTSPEITDQLHRFLLAHQTRNAPRLGLNSDYHELVFIPEPYNSFVRDYDDEWSDFDGEDTAA